MKGTLIVVEGIDGAGKTTQVRMLAAALQSAGLDVRVTKEPTDGPWGRRIRASATEGRMEAAEELDAFMQDRREHVERELAPWLAAGAVVIVDRYYFSNAAYQGVRGLEPDTIIEVNEVFAPVPDLLFILDIDPVTAVARIGTRDGQGNHFEQLDNLQAVRAVFLSLRRSYLQVVPADGDRVSVHKSILQRVADGPLFGSLCLRSDLTACAPEHCPFREQCAYVRLKVVAPDEAEHARRLVAAAELLASKADVTQADLAKLAELAGRR